MLSYAELHCHSYFSLLDGASSPEALVAQAAALGLPALALTDHNAVYGAPRFLRAAAELNVQPVLGAELTLVDVPSGKPNGDVPLGEPNGVDEHHLTLLVTNEAGWHNLCYLISRARHNAPKGEARLSFAELNGCTNGLIALSGCRQGLIGQALWEQDGPKAARTAAGRYVDLFGRDNFWIELQRHYLPGEHLLIPRLTALAHQLGIGCVATNNVHYALPDGHRLQDVLVCIRHNTTLDAATALRRLNSEYYLKSPAQMAALFPEHPQALTNSLRLAERCRFVPDYGLQDLPHFPTPHGMSSSAYLRRLCREAVPRRYTDPPRRVFEQLQHELDVVDEAGLANYFLIVWDMVRFSRENNIRCQGRGSAANSLVAYLLAISPVDPLAHDLVFERFLSPERRAVPDIDIDFDAARREEVIQYIYERYGADHTAMACTFVTFRARSAVRDIGKALGLAPELLAQAARKLRHGQAGEIDEEVEVDEHADNSGTDSGAPLEMLLALSRGIEGFPRHLGIHSGGMIITGSPLMGRAPTEPATMTDRVVVQWDKDALEEVGLVKIDILGLRMLSAIGDAATIVAETTGVEADLDGLTFDDPAVYEMIAQADTIGVFQVESRAQAQVLPKLQPRCYGDLVVSISLIRPGPIQGNMVHPYLRRRQGVESISYTHPLLEPALRETLGVILFQEQVLKVARDLAGFTPGEGELLRRALGAKRATEEIARFHDRFLAGAQANGVTLETAETVFTQLLAFGGYSFAKSHAAAFAVLVYQSGWLKRYHPAAFYTALLNNQPMGFWNAAVLVNELRRQGIRVLPVDIHESRADCHVDGHSESGSIRLGLNYVKRLAEAHIERILVERRKNPFTSLAEFCTRMRIPYTIVENLIAAGAMDGWGVPRRQLIWELGTLHDEQGTLDLGYTPEEVSLPELSPAGAMVMEQEVMGLSPGNHVMTFYRPALRERGIAGSAKTNATPNGRRVRAAGLLVVHQSPPTAKGFHFLTLEDEDGMINVVVRPDVYERYEHIIHAHRLLLVAGEVQQEGGATNLLAKWVAPLPGD